LAGEIQGSEPVVPAERPRGFYTARVDAKGRLKLPSAFQKYLASLKEENYFITTTNETTVYIYPLSEWKKNEAILDNPGNADHVEMFEAVRFVVDKYGADAAIDGEGRMLIPQLLREAFKIQDAQVYLQCGDRVIEVLNEEEYKARERAADKAKLARAKTELKLVGFK
jgi:MraZ protein